MKKIILSTLALFFALVLLASCGKDNAETTEGTSETRSESTVLTEQNTKGNETVAPIDNNAPEESDTSKESSSGETKAPKEETSSAESASTEENKQTSAAANAETTGIVEAEDETSSAKNKASSAEPAKTTAKETPSEKESESQASSPKEAGVESISFDPSWKYADYSLTHSDSVKLYRSGASSKKGKVICVNAGHGCSAGGSKFTYCHPDKTPKVTGGSTAKGEIKARSISAGTDLNDGTPEGTATKELAIVVKNRLLADGYDVLMIRETEDVNLDNIARTVIANNNADCHISLHYDSSETDKGLFFLGVPDVQSYRNMEPVKSHYKDHIRLGEALVKGEKAAGVKIYSNGRMDIDLTQTSYSTVPSVDLEVGDEASDRSPEQLKRIAEGISKGLDIFYS